MSLERQQFAFGDFVLDADERVLLKDGTPVSITPKVFQLLLVLVENQGHLVEKQALMDSVWAGSFVEESNLTFTIRQLRKALGDDKQNPNFVETIPRRGYRFVAPVSVSSTDTTAVEQPDEPKKRPFTGQQNSRPIFYTVSLLTFIAIFLTAGFVAFRSGMFDTTNAVSDASFHDLRFDELTRSDKYTSGSLSPDGKYAAYINTVNDRQSLWLRQLGTGQSNQIVPAEDGVRIRLVEFSGDGEFIYLSRQAEGQPAHVDRVPIFGGVITTGLATGLETEFAVSPDQTAISFHRTQSGKTQLMLSGTDKSQSRPVYETEQTITGNTFSPNGKTIAFAAGDVGPGLNTFGVYTIDAENGKVAEASPRKWNYVRDVVWLGDGKSLLITAQTSNTAPRQLWKIDLSSGQTRQVTETSDNLGYISATKDSRHILISQNSLSSNLYCLSVDKPQSVISLAPAYLGVSWATADSIVYSASNGNEDIWSISPDGSGQRQLTNNSSMDFQPIVSPDGRYAVFLSDRSGKLNVWRMNPDGSDQVQLTSGDGEQGPSISPDGKYVIYSSIADGKMWKTAISGGEPTVIDSAGVTKVAVSPDARFSAHFEGSEMEKKIILRDQDAFKAIRQFSLPPGLVAGHELIWSRDGSALAYIGVSKESGSNIWSQPINGAPPRKLTEFNSLGIFYFDFSPDGSKIAVIRGSWSFQVVIAKVPES